MNVSVAIKRRLPQCFGKAVETYNKLEELNIFYDLDLAKDYLVIPLLDYLLYGPFYGHITDRLYAQPVNLKERFNYSIIKIRSLEHGDHLYLMCGRFRAHMYRDRKVFFYDNENDRLFWTHYFGLPG